MCAVLIGEKSSGKSMPVRWKREALGDNSLKLIAVCVKRFALPLKLIFICGSGALVLSFDLRNMILVQFALEFLRRKNIGASDCVHEVSEFSTV